MNKFPLIITAIVAFCGIAGAQEKGANPTGPSNSAKATTQKLPRLVDLGASKCVPCKMMAPILEDLKKEYAGRMDVEFIDVWKTPEAGTEYGVRMIPTQILYGADGKELFRHEGFFGKDDILTKWKELKVELKGAPLSEAVGPTSKETKSQ